MEKDLIQQRVWNTKQVVTIVGFAIAITFSVTMIWGRFLFIENRTQILDDKIELYNVNTNNRIDKKTSRIEGSVEKLSDDVDKLKLPNSDK